jgi:hypothetical protein
MTNPSIHIQNFDLTCESTVKLLGIDIDYQLNVDAHISTICRKASQQLNILKRLGSYLNRLNKLTTFHTFIFSNFNFCKLRHTGKKRRTVHRSEQELTWQVPLWTLVQDPHTDGPT